MRLVGATLIRSDGRRGIDGDRVRCGEPLAAHLAPGVEHVVEAPFRLADWFRDVGDVDHRVLVQVGPVVLEEEDVGARPRLDGGGDARLQVIAVDRLEDNFGAEGLRSLGHLALELDVGFGDEVHPPHPVQLGPLGEGGARRAARIPSMPPAMAAATLVVRMKARRFTRVSALGGVLGSVVSMTSLSSLTGKPVLTRRRSNEGQFVCIDERQFQAQASAILNKEPRACQR